MSLFNDISGAFGNRPVMGAAQPPAPGSTQEPGQPTAAQRLASRFGGVFQTTFNSTMATVFERGAAGEFDDPTLRLQEQAALERLRAAQQATRTEPRPATGVRGANAAPDAQPAPGQGGEPAVAASTGTASVAVAERRQLYALRVRQSEARLTNISSTLARDFPKATQLASASTGTWDPATFVPRSHAEVEAFAHRMVIDATEAAARLEIVKTQLDAARFEVANGGGEAVVKLVAELEAAYARQKTYVDKLATIVNEQSGGQVVDAGMDALAGMTMRDAGDLPVAELAADLRASGMSEEQVRLVIGASELSVEQEKTPGGSPRLRQVAADMTATLLARFNLVREQRQDEFRRQEQERADEERLLDRRLQERRVADRAATEQHQQRVETRQVQEQQAAQRAAEFEQWMATLEAARAQERQAAS